ncbi:MAG: TrmH family RNA methyltransferase, partial [Bacteroidota bacterium]
LMGIDYLKDSGVQVIACDERGDTRLWDAELSGPLCLVVGAEGEGIPKKIRAACSGSINIPMAGEINSLNVSVATGMAMYEIQRQRTSAVS